MGTYETFVFIVKMADHDGNHGCLIEKNVPIALILPSRWQDGAERLGIEHTSCLCHYIHHFEPQISISEWNIKSI